MSAAVEQVGRGEPLLDIPPRENTAPPHRRGLWLATCAALVLPVAAIAHNAVFFPLTCMLNPFGMEYDLETTARWLANDPSLLVGLLIAVLVFGAGERIALVRLLALCFALAFMPLALWIWDLPWTGRFICMEMHDHRFLLMEGLPLRTRHFYALGFVAFPALSLVALRAQLGRLPALAKGIARIAAPPAAARS